jgi:hypothetical protein
MTVDMETTDDLVLRSAPAAIEGDSCDLPMAPVEVQGLGMGGALRGGLLQLGWFGWRRWLRRSAATASPAPSIAAGWKVLAGDPVVVAVEAIGIARFQIFLRFLLSREIGAVVIASVGRPRREEEDGSNDRDNEGEKNAETSDWATLAKHKEPRCWG